MTFPGVKLQAVLAVVTMVAIAATLLAILILVDKVQTGFWLSTLSENELLEPAVNVTVLLLNSKNQFFFVCSDGRTPGFGSELTSCFYSAEAGTLSTDRGLYFTRDSSGKFVLADEMPAGAVLRMHFSAGNNRGYLAWFDVKSNSAHWLHEDLTWTSNMPVARPFVFLSSEPLA